MKGNFEHRPTNSTKREIKRGFVRAWSQLVSDLFYLVMKSK